MDSSGPAFPSGDQSNIEPFRGLTLRDYFAAAALTGLCADTAREGDPADYAKDAYDIADAMLAAREPSS